MRKFIAMLLACVLVFGVVGSAVAITPGAIFDEIDIMEANGKLSNDLITQAIINLSFIESQGTVVATVYDSVYENKTVNTYTDLLKQPPWPCVTKLTHFVFELTNQYRLQETDIAISIGSYDTDLTVSTYVYGQCRGINPRLFLSQVQSIQPLDLLFQPPAYPVCPYDGFFAL